MSFNHYGSQGTWSWLDSPFDDSAPWRELQSLAKRAGVPPEELCQIVEQVTCFAREQKTTSASYDDDLEEVVRVLADGEFDFELEAKAEWHEADHPRDERGRFSNGNHTSVLEADDKSLATSPPGVDKSKAYKDVRKIQEALSQIYPNLTSRWKGSLEIKPKAELKAAGLKRWSCSIGIAEEQFANAAKMVCSMLHESLHAFSPTSSDEIDLARSWEEAVIEGAVHVHRAGMATRLGLYITPEEFQERDMNHPYRYFYRSLERLRGALGVTNQRAFYDDMMHLPAPEIEGYILALADKLSPKQREKFNRTYLFEKKILDNEWDPKKGAYKNSPEQEKLQTKAMTRDEVLFAILYARTREAVAAAQKMRDEWVRLHPDDDEIFEASESLEMLAEAQKLRDNGSAQG